MFHLIAVDGGPAWRDSRWCARDIMVDNVKEGQTRDYSRDHALNGLERIADLVAESDGRWQSEV